MPRSLFEHLSPDTGPKRILALDGGGVKSILTLGMLKPLEAELQRRARNPDLRLADYYDLIGGTSTGAIIAAGLALGLSVDQLTDLYQHLGPDVYGRGAGDGVLLHGGFNGGRLRSALVSAFGSRTIGSDDLKTGLAICAKRIDTGAPWLVANHPLSRFYDPAPESGMFATKRFRLVDVVLASAGAPSLFDATIIDTEFDDKRHSLARGAFVDGAISGNFNPGVQLFMLALEPSYQFGWKPGADALMMTSFGSGARRPSLTGRDFAGLPASERAAQALQSIVFETQMQGIMWLQAFSEPKRPWRINSEIGDMAGKRLSAEPLLDYQRIDVVLDSKPKRKSRRDPIPPMTALERLIGRELEAEVLQALGLTANGKKDNIALLYEIGLAAGKTFVDESYPNPAFNLVEWGA